MIAGMLACSLAAGMTLVEYPDGIMTGHDSTTLASLPDLGPVARFTTRYPPVREGGGVNLNPESESAGVLSQRAEYQLEGPAL